MLKQSDLKIGNRVHYQPSHFGKDQWENGIIKEIPIYTTQSVRVVYNCNNKWYRYMDYTSVLTHLGHLKLGWR